MRKVFFSWQSDRPTRVCRNFIEASLQAAIKRINAKADIESSKRPEINVDRDTKGVPGSPAIVDTILSKIADSSIFVPDLTFAGQRSDGTPVANPNVLIEYGYALNKPGRTRIVAVMNEAYGEPTSSNMPFNLVHTRFPITYKLPEDAADEPRTMVKESLTKDLAVALALIFDSDEYRSTDKAHLSPLDHAAVLRSNREYDYAVSSMSVEGVRENLEKLFQAIQSKCAEVASEYGELELECGWEIGRMPACVLKVPFLGIALNWNQLYGNSLDNAKLDVAELAGILYLPGTFPGGMHLPPKPIGTSVYKPSISKGEYALEAVS